MTQSWRVTVVKADLGIEWFDLARLHINEALVSVEAEPGMRQQLYTDVEVDRSHTKLTGISGGRHAIGETAVSKHRSIR